MKVANPFIQVRNENIRTEFLRLNETMDYTKALKIIAERYRDLSSNTIQIILLGLPRWRECAVCGTRYPKGHKKTKYCPKCFYTKQRPEQRPQIKIEESENFSWRELKSSIMVTETYLNRDTERRRSRVTIQKHNGIVTLAL